MMEALLQHYAQFWIFYAGLIGLMVGSFLNVAIYRLPIIFSQKSEGIAKADRMTLSRPCSSCPHCGHKITPIENIPVLSFLALRGKCRHCKSPISFRYPLVEIVTGCLSGLAAFLFPFGVTGGLAVIAVWVVVYLSISIYEKMS